MKSTEFGNCEGPKLIDRETSGQPAIYDEGIKHVKKEDGLVTARETSRDLFEKHDTPFHEDRPVKRHGKTIERCKVKPSE